MSSTKFLQSPISFCFHKKYIHTKRNICMLHCTCISSFMHLFFCPPHASKPSTMSTKFFGVQPQTNSISCRVASNKQLDISYLNWLFSWDIPLVTSSTDLPVSFFCWEMFQKNLPFKVTCPVNWNESPPSCLGCGGKSWSHCHLQWLSRVHTNARLFHDWNVLELDNVMDLSKCF